MSMLGKEKVALDFLNTLKTRNKESLNVNKVITIFYMEQLVVFL